MTESQTLLADYARTGSEAAFRELVTRYIDFVYSAASRMVDGAPHLAEDVVQIVFADLARMAHSLSREVMLGRWLHRHTCFVAAKTMRTERRRQSREREATQMNALLDHSDENLARIAPILDDAINRLGTADRTAILLRFFEQREFRAIGLALGSNEDAARKRISRALEKLQLLLKNRGVTLSAVALGTLLTAGLVKAAPPGMAATVSISAIASASAGGASTATLLKIMAMTKLKTGIAAAIIVTGVTASFVIQHQAQAKILAIDSKIQNQPGQSAAVHVGNRDKSTMDTPTSNTENPADELARLRAMAAQLRSQTNDLAPLAEENHRLQQQASQNPRPQSVLQAKAQNMRKMSFSRTILTGFYIYADDNKGQFPTNFDQVTAILGNSALTNGAVTPDQFEIVYQGAKTVTNASTTVVFREIKPMHISNGNWTRVYAFADGHVEVANSNDGSFDAWEDKHIVGQPLQ